MESLTNVTFEEIKVGDQASVSRRLSATEVEALALAGGCVDDFQITEGQAPQTGQVQTESVGAEALLLGLLNRRLPGPGSSIAAQDLHFEGHIQTGDELVATVTARKKHAQSKLVEFDCSLRSDGHDLITGTITVRAPERRLHYAQVAEPEVILRRTDKYAMLMKKCEPLPAVTCAIVYPCDRDSLLGPIEAAKLGLIQPVLVGPEDKIRAIAKAEGVDLSPYRLVPAEHSHAAAETAVALVRAAEVEALMKGSLHTDALMSAVVSSTTGLRTSRRISHVFLMDVPTHPQPLAITDAAINIFPTLEDKMHIARTPLTCGTHWGWPSPKWPYFRQSRRSIPRFLPPSRRRRFARWPSVAKLPGPSWTVHWPSTMPSVSRPPARRRSPHRLPARRTSSWSRILRRATCWPNNCSILPEPMPPALSWAHACRSS